MGEASFLLLTGPSLISFLGSLALFIAGFSLRTGRHTLVWAVGFAAIALQWALLAAWAALGMSATLLFLSGLAGLAGPVLLAHGFRLRHGGPTQDRLFFGVALIAALVLAASSFGPWAGDWAGRVGAVMKGGFMSWAAAQLVQPNRRVRPAEWAAAAMLTIQILANFLYGLGPLLSHHAARPTTDEGFLICAMAAGPLSASAVLFMMLLIASDYSGDRKRLVHTDPLTGVLNRAGFEAIARLAVRRRPLSIAMADIDHFKAVNDEHGHAAGDAVLTALARRLGGAVRPAETNARIGGEEFVLLLHERGEAARQRVEELRAAIEALAFDGYPEVGITASFGIAEHRRGETLSSAVDRADRALYQSKRDGRNRTTMAEAG